MRQRASSLVPASNSIIVRKESDREAPLERFHIAVDGLLERAGAPSSFARSWPCGFGIPAMRIIDKARMRASAGTEKDPGRDWSGVFC
jgi:hypothetical protein